ncbi:hypothetical protein [Petrotoga sp. SL27]|uniref:hypothetical protein n=1 Tax=Petrotoga sp. SL27 TaxID=1445612 RepID=UPI000CDEADA4|nr:hypothetical protein [Petrotoga sp. SL27]POZ90604.1 hypothetical protein AD60_06315 [Petrotoga sp. SL27]
MKGQKNLFLMAGEQGERALTKILFLMGGEQGEGALTKILFLTGGQRGKGAIKLIIQELDNKITHLQKHMV